MRGVGIKNVEWGDKMMSVGREPEFASPPCLSGRSKFLNPPAPPHLSTSPFPHTSIIKMAGQWRFQKDVIDKWISEQSLERVTQSIKSSLRKKAGENNHGKA